MNTSLQSEGRLITARISWEKTLLVLPSRLFPLSFMKKKKIGNGTYKFTNFWYISFSIISLIYVRLCFSFLNKVVESKHRSSLTQALRLVLIR